MPGRTGDPILDDTLVPRCAKSGPGIRIKHDHSHQANRPTFLNSQCWVTLALVVRVRLGSALTVPIRSWLLEESGQRGKLWVARQLMDSIRGQVKGVRLLIDAWFMRCSLILPLLEQQVRIQLWESFPLMAIAPWRKGAMITAGLFAQWLRMQFIGLPVRDAYDPKSGQFVMPFPGQDQRLQC